MPKSRNKNASTATATEATDGKAAPSHTLVPGSLKSQLRAAEEKAKQKQPKSDEKKPKGPNRFQIHRYPAPIKTFPLPAVIPHNPVSWAYFAYEWLRQTGFTQREPATVHVGTWCPATRSVDIHDEKSMTALWEQGFFGKGKFSRSVPNWQKVQDAKQGKETDWLAELHVEARRRQRAELKWERARVQQEAIWQNRLQELLALPPPVGPLELLALPNSLPLAPSAQPPSQPGHEPSPHGDLDSEAKDLPNGYAHAPGSSQDVLSSRLTMMDANGPDGVDVGGSQEGTRHNVGSSNGSSNDSPPGGWDDTKPAPMKRRKSVRFSPKVESTTFQLSDPPSPGIAMLNGKTIAGNGAPSETTNGIIVTGPPRTGSLVVNGHKAEEHDVEELAASATTMSTTTAREHLQLTREEAFFLSFGIGALSIVDEDTKKPVPSAELFELFRRYSYVPDPVGPADVRPDDKFLLNYAFYHKARSDGWVPRVGLKFGVDWLLYHKGPAFDHAEYGVVVLPSYGHPWWEEHGQETPQPTWHQMHATMRALSQVFKTFRPITIEIPPMPMFDAAMELGIHEVLSLYEFDSVINKRFKFSRLRRTDAKHLKEVKEKRVEAMQQKEVRQAEKKRRKEERKQNAGGPVEEVANEPDLE